MSSSNIIKHHHFQQTAVLIGVVDASPAANRDARQVGDEQAVLASGRNRAISPMGRAEDAIEKARAAAEEILSEAARTVEEMQREAREQGYRDGYVKGLAAAETETAESVGRLAALASGAVVDMEQLVSTAEEAVVKLALSVAEKVVYKSAADDRSLVVSMVRGALEHVDVIDVVRIRVHPDDLDLLRANWTDGYVGSAGKNWELMPDPRVQLGGCIIDTNNAVVDAQLATKLAEIEKAFWAEFKTGAR